MQAIKTTAIFAALFFLALANSSCDKAAHAQAVAGGANAEILDNPDILLSSKPAAELTLNGVKLGDPVSAIPGNIIKFKHDNHLDCTNASYAIVNGQVWSMSLTDHQKLAEMHVPQDDPDMIQMRLGKADQIDAPEGDNKKTWKGYWFATNRTAHFSADDDYTGWISITVCR